MIGRKTLKNEQETSFEYKFSKRQLSSDKKRLFQQRTPAAAGIEWSEWMKTLIDRIEQGIEQFLAIIENLL